MEWEVTTDWTIVLRHFVSKQFTWHQSDLFKSKTKDNFHEYINKQNADIQFTKEIEENGIYNLF